MIQLDIGTIAFNQPWAIEEQIRLFGRYVTDAHRLVVFDNSSRPEATEQIHEVCVITRTDYVRVAGPEHGHPKALTLAANLLRGCNTPYMGFIDHDIYPVRETALIPLIDRAGFLGIGQRHSPTNKLYAWPGFLFFKREWLGTRTLDFDGIRGASKRDDGDCGSMLWPLFQDEDWSKLFLLEHGYTTIREPDDHGLQSFGVERIGDFVHATNVSGWKQVPDAPGRERLLREMLAEL